jgi:hypothetical protein
MAKYTIKVKALVWAETEVEVQTYQGDEDALALVEAEIDDLTAAHDFEWTATDLHQATEFQLVSKIDEEDDDKVERVWPK